MVNNIKNNTISEISAKKDLNTLNEPKNVGIRKQEKRTSGQRELLNLFNDLSDTILTDKTLKSKSQEDKNENENDKTLISSKDDDETKSQNEKKEMIKGKNDILDEIIDKSKSFAEQIKSLKKLEGLKGDCPYINLGDKELKFKYFKIELAKMSNEIDKKLFEQIFGHTPIKLANKLKIQQTNKQRRKSNNC